MCSTSSLCELGARGAAALGLGDADAAFADLGSALQLWTGPAFGDLARGPVLEVEARRLEEERIVVVEQWAEAGLRRRTPDNIMATLVGLVADNPYRERLRGHLMRALYQAYRDRPVARGLPAHARSLQRPARGRARRGAPACPRRDPPP